MLKVLVFFEDITTGQKTIVDGLCALQKKKKLSDLVISLKLAKLLSLSEKSRKPESYSIKISPAEGRIYRKKNGINFHTSKKTMAEKLLSNSKRKCKKMIVLNIITYQKKIILIRVSSSKFSCNLLFLLVLVPLFLLLSSKTTFVFVTFQFLNPPHWKFLKLFLDLNKNFARMRMATFL